ncbi:PREDICTED: B3 domain-containing protein REM10-like isoform X2 [Brassica oleracea var. oleracea]|uniref:B3 domain-containing protein REM10-like isoform X2 n=1 Tax=Brassica oleracea var. oleracea TaxID=109376 RepID=UPI0006A74D35|nr:PREDICTED: B3 domain-containing protein REM10-like isoform X2 [Brassica oleracea var. oleracea]
MTFYSKHIKGTTNEGNANAVVKLRSDASDLTWEVKMDGRRLTQGWQEFTTSHDLRVGDIVIFRHDGDLLFHVTTFGPSCCEIQYDDDVFQISSDSDSEMNQETREAVSPSDKSCFVARVTPANLRKNTLFLPRGFSRSNGLMNREGEIFLLNEYGKPWTALLSYYKKTGDVYLRRGWRNFCHENQKRANDLLTFKLVQEGTKPVLQLCSSMYNRGSSSTSEDRFLTLTLTHYNFKKCKLCLPATFLKANGIKSARKITLVDRYGIKRTTSLKPDNNYGRMRVGKGWRESSVKLME